MNALAEIVIFNNNPPFYEIKQLMKKLLLWTSYYYNVNNSMIDKNLITKSVNSFWKEISKTVESDQHVISLFRIQTEDNIVLTLGQLQKLSLDDKDYYINYINDILSLKTDEYSNKIITQIVFSYGVRTGSIDKNVLLKDVIKDTEYLKYKNYKLPVTLDPLKYGKLLYFDKKNNTFVIQIGQLTQAIVKKSSGFNEVNIMKYGNIVLTYKDTILENGKFIRELGKTTYHYNENNKLEIVSVHKTNKFIETQSSTRLLNNKFITLDIETKLVDNIHVPYLISYFDGKISRSFFSTDYNSPIEMIQDCILSLCRFKYNRNKIYIHNLANFDGIFLLKAIAEIGELKVLMNNEKLISFDFHFKPSPFSKYEIVLNFRDSYQILLASLAKLGKSFNVKTIKTIFPYRFINENDLNYNGSIPSINFFDNITNDEYLNYSAEFKNKKWNLRLEAIKYCVNDCKSLFEVILKYNLLYFDNFNININEHVTLSSHAFRVYRTHFMKNNTIPKIYGLDYKIIKKSYTGGSTDMFIPTNRKNELVYGYDVNSLYPFIMANFPMPVGNKTYFEGDIRKINPEAFGFFNCIITTPKNLKHPILQTHVPTKSGIRTLSALGTYEDMIFSPSMDNAIKLGYKFEILKGYTFDKEIIFKEYVEALYKFRLNYPKSDPMNYIAKLFLNSLYGKFGMRDEFDSIKLISDTEFSNLDNINKLAITDIINLGHKFLIKFKQNNDNMFDEINSNDYNINVAIASAITSYARDYMSQFKNNPKIKLFYTDTDSIYTNLSPDKMNKLIPGIINQKELGKLKLESVSKKAIFLAPKCYGLLDKDNNFTFKVKGLTNKVNLTLNDFEKLLIKNSNIQKAQLKTFKSFEQGNIKVLKQIYTLQQTDNKRKLIFNSRNKLINTKPYIINKYKIISNNK
jgi:DNA polymerase type B, organellar and viral